MLAHPADRAPHLRNATLRVRDLPQHRAVRALQQAVQPLARRGEHRNVAGRVEQRQVVVPRLARVLGASITADRAAAGLPPFEYKTLPRVAATSVWPAVIATGEQIGGRYCQDCQIAPVDDAPASATA